MSFVTGYMLRAAIDSRLREIAKLERARIRFLKDGQALRADSINRTIAYLRKLNEQGRNLSIKPSPNRREFSTHGF